MFLLNQADPIAGEKMSMEQGSEEPCFSGLKISFL